MKKLIPLAVLASLFVSSCENLTPGENAAVAGGTVGAITGGVLALSGVSPSITIPVAAGAAVVAGGAAYIVSKQQATKKQEEIALYNARLAEARLIEQQKKEAASRATAKKSAKKPKYIAVDTVASEQSPSKSKQVMIYDTESKRIVGNSVYNLEQKPKEGSTAKYDTMTAQYVGR